ncbi:MAG TPA: cytochrome c [Rhodocyclaceae bacterium]|nr:cytochrome c [Rhodocyclaceae bacterium]
MKKKSILLLAAMVLAACGGEPEDTRPGQPVAHRRAAFNEIIKSFEPMGVMMRTGEYDGVKFRALAQNVVALRDGPWQYFKPDTLYPPSKAKPEVWSQPDKFEAERKAFFEATDKLAAAVGASGPAPDAKAVQPAYQAVEDSCRSCHKAFKNK